MATVRLDNLIKPRFKNLPTGDLKKENDKSLPTYTDLKLDMQISKSIGDGLNVIDTKDILVSTDEQAIKNSLNNIFSTKRGEKILNPEFGSSLEMFLFEPITPFIAKSIGDTILQNIRKYEPRIVINNVNVYPRPDENMYIVKIYYSNMNLNNVMNITLNKEGIIFL